MGKGISLLQMATEDGALSAGKNIFLAGDFEFKIKHDCCALIEATSSISSSIETFQSTLR